MSIQGVDLSNWNGNISDQQAQEAKAQGLDFAYILLTDGKSFRNPLAVQQTATLRKAGILVGFYHFFRPADPVYDQVVNFLMYAHGCGGSALPLALDSEVNGTTWQQLAYQMMQFARQIEQVNTDVTNTHSLLYVNLNFYNNLPGFPWGRWVWFARPGVSAPDKPCLVWQQAPRPLPPAFPNSTDYDVFLGSDADWAAFTQSTPPVTPVTPGPEVPLQKPLDITLPLALDPNGHGYYTYAALGLPANANIINVTPLGADPASTGGYSPDDVVKAFDYIDVAGHQEVVVYGVPNGRYSVRIEWDTV